MSDSIKRQDAINAANDWLFDCLRIHKQNRSCGLIRRLEDLPPAEPERAIKDCRNCKHGNYNDHWDTYFCYHSDDCNDWDKWEQSAQSEIIRCKDCKYWNHEVDLTYCERVGWTGTDAYDYCSFAERKEDG